jgi:hypothetical protein
MRAALAFATLLSLLPLEPATAQDWTAPRSTDAATRKWEKAPPATAAKKRAQSNETAAAEARARNEARERAWDADAKRTMRSICSGASGC